MRSFISMALCYSNASGIPPVLHSLHVPSGRVQSLSLLFGSHVGEQQHIPNRWLIG